MDRDSLYLLVTEAILRAETLESLGAPGTASAYLDVSLLEEQIAEGPPPSSPEGALARRGAVRAAVAAGALQRANDLFDRYRNEEGATDELRDDLGDILAAGLAQHDALGEEEAVRPEPWTAADEWDGVVLAVEREAFVAWMHPVNDVFAEQEVTFSVTEVTPADRPFVRPGAVFRWHGALVEETSGRFVQRSFLIFPSVLRPSLVDRLAGKHLADRIEEVFGTPLSA